MDRIHYAGDIVLTGSDIAHAMLDYAKALARTGDSATVNIPVRREDGTQGRAEFLIGPASQLVSETVPSDGDEIIDTEIVASFTAAARSLGTPEAAPVATDYSATSSGDLDLPD
jgi:hypothetical protein